MTILCVMFILCAMTILQSKLTPPQLAKRWGVSADKIVGFIKSGELRAIDVSSNRGSVRPRYLIDQRDIEAFEASRAVVAPTPKPKRRRRRRDPAIKEYF